MDGRGCLNKHQPPILGNFWHFACPVGLSNASADLGMWHYLLRTRRSLYVADADSRRRRLLEQCGILIHLWRNYCDLDTMRYAFNIAMFDTMRCIVPSLYSDDGILFACYRVFGEVRLLCVLCRNLVRLTTYDSSRTRTLASLVAWPTSNSSVRTMPHWHLKDVNRVSCWLVITESIISHTPWHTHTHTHTQF